MGFMAGKRALIVGVASDRSIATGIAEAFAREGAEIAGLGRNDGRSDPEHVVAAE